MSVGVCAWISALSSCSWSKLKSVCRSFLWLLIFSALLPHLHFQNFQITSTMSPLTNLSNPVLSIYLSIYLLLLLFKKFISKVLCCFSIFLNLHYKKKREFPNFPKFVFARNISCFILVLQKFSLPSYPKLIVLTIDNWQFYVKIFIFLGWKHQVVLNWTFQIFDSQKNKYIECTLYLNLYLKFTGWDSELCPLSCKLDLQDFNKYH